MSDRKGHAKFTLGLLGLVAGACLWIAPQAKAEDLDLRAIADVAELQAALADDLSGQILVLAPGTYGMITLRGSGAPSAITSADPHDLAIIEGIAARDFDRLRLENLVLEYRFSPEDPIHVRPFRFSDCRRLELLNTRVRGDLAQGTGDASEGHGYGVGLAIRNCRDVRIEHTHLSVLHRGLVIRESDNVAILDNEVTRIRSDGMNFAQVSNVRIERNHIHDFDRAPDSSDHADMIQFWTNGTTEPSRNIVIRDNVLNSGRGLYTQSIFMRNELVDRGLAGPEMFYQNVRIENNLILNAHVHGISLGETERLRILQNTMIQNIASANGDVTRRLYMPQIRVRSASRDVAIEGNITHNIVGVEDQPDWKIGRNLLIQNEGRLSDLPGLHYSLVFDGETYLSAPDQLESWRLISNGPGDRPGLGSTLLP